MAQRKSSMSEQFEYVEQMTKRMYFDAKKLPCYTDDEAENVKWTPLSDKERQQIDEEKKVIERLDKINNRMLKKIWEK